MDWVALIPALPAIAFALLAPLPRALRNRLRWLGLAAVGGSFVLSVMAFAAVWPGGVKGAVAHDASWAIALVGGVDLSLGLRLDAVAAAMLLMVTIVGACVQVYSLHYMRAEERVGWYFAVLTLFTAAMLVLVLARDFLTLYMAWEVMGLCSYLLIGFWHEKAGPRRASQKAFLTTRVGDVGFAIALAIIYATTGSFEFDVVLGSAADWAPGVATAVALLLLFGAMGKSAQVPLHVWLPDAMAGPTPASALIHAATMVAAGVYLVIRALPIFEASGVALTVTMLVGALTALLGGLVAAVQHDLKRVLAYSTISQLGFMFLAIGAGGAVAGMFHLVTHAFFKSLLFLGAGVVIHATHAQDMREMGGVAKSLPATSVLFGVGALALAGVFPFSGFWSKDEILYATWKHGHHLVFFIALFAALVTAFYVARLWCRVFAGPGGSKRLVEGHPVMLVPMGLLAAITAVVGVAAPAFSEFLGYTGHWPDPAIALTSSFVALGGLALGWLTYGRRDPVLNVRALVTRAPRLYSIVEQRFYFDAVYDRLLVRPYIRATEELSRFDRVWVDGAVNGVAALWRAVSERAWEFDVRVIDRLVNESARVSRASGSTLRRLQTGRVQTYQRYVLGALVALMVWIMVKGA
ncbi:MAG TPA: NADH-quinone oxidoreductase subunit L [Coriobacteriia bacterium]|nr:NADH-quinone oxidoreductase subunit L [Coriobacteriia bacterium]